MTSNSRIVVDEDDPDVDVEKPPFSPRDVTIRNDKGFADEFRVIDFLGRGKFGEVKRCVELGSGREFAAKFIATPRPQDRKDVEHEVAMMRKLHHRRLVQLYDAFESKKEMCLVLEIVYGGELFDRAISDDFLLTEKACVCIVRQVCEGVEYIHSQNIIHLDMKPENILCLTKSGNRIKIIDFGLAREYNPKVDTRVLFGTPEFMAPEVVQYDPIDFSTDMWSIGVICYVLLSGLSPFMGDNDADTLSNVIRGRFGFDYPEFGDVSLDARDMISKLLVPDKKKRLSASQCLEHPWLKKRPQPKTPTLELTKIQLKHFVYRRRWQKIVNALIALKRMGVDIKSIRSNLTAGADSAVTSTTRKTSLSPQINNNNIKPLMNNVKTPASATVPHPSSSSTTTTTKTKPTVLQSVPVISPPTSKLVQPSIASSPTSTSPTVKSPGVDEETATMKRCRKAGVDPVPVPGNGHVFNLSKMIQMNRAAHREDEHRLELPSAIWQKDPIRQTVRKTSNPTSGNTDAQSKSVQQNTKPSSLPNVESTSRHQEIANQDKTVRDAEPPRKQNPVEELAKTAPTSSDSQNSKRLRSPPPPTPPKPSLTARSPPVPAYLSQTLPSPRGSAAAVARTQPSQLAPIEDVGASKTPSSAGLTVANGVATSPSSTPFKSPLSNRPTATCAAAAAASSPPPSVPASASTSPLSAAPTTKTKDAALIRDRVRFFNKKEPTTTSGSSTPPVVLTGGSSTLKTSWFRRNNLLK